MLSLVAQVVWQEELHKANLVHGDWHSKSQLPSGEGVDSGLLWKEGQIFISKIDANEVHCVQSQWLTTLNLASGSSRLRVKSPNMESLLFSLIDGVPEVVASEDERGLAERHIWIHICVANSHGLENTILLHVDFLKLV